MQFLLTRRRKNKMTEGNICNRQYNNQITQSSRVHLCIFYINDKVNINTNMIATLYNKMKVDDISTFEKRKKKLTYTTLESLSSNYLLLFPTTTHRRIRRCRNGSRSSFYYFPNQLRVTTFLFYNCIRIDIS